MSIRELEIGMSFRWHLHVVLEFERNLEEKRVCQGDDSPLRSVFLTTDKLRLGQQEVSGEFPFELDESLSLVPTPLSAISKSRWNVFT
ncbi:hypothetical protein CEXT_622731 [Caerostris extrusa]|uniref:Uncharacterized protein n=1 Tax=Caerostris extrusa TaxID=172846 RepID=A0AAV4N6K8_CAEEX|nr:hypothetical protein CEXT_622731 [Caerostris extrusa]